MTIQNDLSEKEPSKLAIVLFTLLMFSVMHLWFMTIPSLNSAEAFNALMASDMSLGSGAEGLTNSEGFLTQYPLYSIILAQLGRFLPLTEFVCRVPAFLAVFGMTLMAGYTAARSTGHRAGLTAASVVLVGFGVGFLRIDGNALLSGFLISSGWILWYRSSRLWNVSWFLVWGFSLFPVFTAIWAIGLKAIFIFYIPLVLMRRPLKARKRLSQIHHVIVFSVYIIIFMLFKHGLLGDGFVVELENGVDRGLVEFLFLTILLVFPWCFIGWPIFCMAFQGVQKTPVFDQFIKTVLLTVSIVSILFFREVKMIIPLLPIFAIATGVHYDIFMRRYYLQVRLISRIFTVLTSILLVWSLIVPIFINFDLLGTGLYSFSDSFIALAVTALSLLLTLFLSKKKVMIYSCRLAVITACFTISAYSNYQVVANDFDYAKESGVLAENLESYTKAYLLVERKCYRESYYLGRKVVSVKTAEQLPKNDEVVHVVTSGDAPILESREWKLVSSAEFPDGKLAMWHGKKRPELTIK